VPIVFYSKTNECTIVNRIIKEREREKEKEKQNKQYIKNKKIGREEGLKAIL
jgi:hypothetical protein